MFGCGGRDIFEQDDPPAPSPQSSLYGMSQLIRDVNLPTQEDPEDIPPHSPETEAALQPTSLDLSAEVEWKAPFSLDLEEVVEIGHFHDPCLSSPLAERIPLD